MSFILGIDTSSVDLGIGLYKDTTAVASSSRYIGHSHAEHISQAVDFILVNNGITSKDVDHIAIAHGPGSFTGLRIGIGFVKGFCLGRQIAVLPISSLEVLAHARRNDPGPIMIAIDARRDDVFWARFQSENGRIKRISPDTLTSVNVFRDTIGEHDFIITDTMGFPRSTAFQFLTDRPRTCSVNQLPPNRGIWCAQRASELISDRQVWSSPMNLLPNYLRSSAAQAKRG